MIDRPTWGEYYLGVAEKVSEMGTCGRKKAGAIIVNPMTKEIVSTGYNGAARGLDHCTDMTRHICAGGCLNDEGRCIKSIHAEHNAILFAKRDLTDMVMYCTDEPCENCTKYIVQVGIKKVIFKNAYANKYNRYFIGDVEIKQFEDDKAAMYKYTCMHCGIEFSSYDPDLLYCSSKECVDKGRRLSGPKLYRD